jgi:transcriptional regulator with XRE-family HTH domain
MENPYRYARRESGLTQEQLSAQTQLSRNYILRVEQGLYHIPSPRIATILTEHFPMYLNGDPEKYLEAYSDWIAEERRQVQDTDFHRRLEFYLEDTDMFSVAKDRPSVAKDRPERHPHIFFRETLVGKSLIDYCKTVKVQQSIIQAYELSPKLVFPSLEKIALNGCGVTIAQIHRVEQIFTGSCN